MLFQGEWLTGILAVEQFLQAIFQRLRHLKSGQISWKIDFKSQSHWSLRVGMTSLFYHWLDGVGLPDRTRSRIEERVSPPGLIVQAQHRKEMAEHIVTIRAADG